MNRYDTSQSEEDYCIKHGLTAYVLEDKEDEAIDVAARFYEGTEEYRDQQVAHYILVGDWP